MKFPGEDLPLNFRNGNYSEKIFETLETTSNEKRLKIQEENKFEIFC